MTKKKKRLIIFGAIFGTVYIVAMMFFVVSIPWILIYLGVASEELPEPKVSYAEFPFELVYEINGERKEIKDTLIIEFEGFSMNEGTGKDYVWNTYCKSQIGTDRFYGDYCDEELVLFEGYVEEYDSKVTLRFELGSCEYYMGVENQDIFDEMHNIHVGDVWVNSSPYTGPISEDELYEKYSIKIIKKSLSPPIS